MFPSFTPPFLPSIALLAIGIPAAIWDARTYRIPDALSIGGIVLSVATCIAFYPWFTVDAIITGSISFFLFFIIRVATKGLGLGDAKLAAFAGATLGFRLAFFAFAVAALLGIATATVLVALGRIDRRAPIPFGPFIVAGAVAVRIASLYPV